MRRHPVQGSDAEERSKDDDDNKRKDDDTDQPKGSDAGHLCAGVGDAVSTQKPKDGYTKTEAKEAAPGRRKKASSGDQGTQKQKKARVALTRKVKPGNSGRVVDSSAIFKESSLSMYFNLL